MADNSKSADQMATTLSPEKLPVEKLLNELPTHLTYAAVLDIRNVEHEITEWMVRKACQEMDKVQQFPFTVQHPASN